MLLIWLYVISIAVLIGAALNAAVETVWPRREITEARATQRPATPEVKPEPGHARPARSSCRRTGRPGKIAGPAPRTAANVPPSPLRQPRDPKEEALMTVVDHACLPGAR